MQVKRLLYLAGRVIKFTILALVTVFIIDVIYLSVSAFHDDEFKYVPIFKHSYQQSVGKKLARKALGMGRIEFYSAGSEGICVVELNRYNNVLIENIKIRNQDSGVKREDFPRGKSSIRADGFPFVEVIIYPVHFEIKNIDIFITTKIEKAIKTDDYIYIRFKGSSVRFKSVEKYPEFSFLNISDPPVELMILKKDDKNLIIFKYGIDRDKRGFTVPLTSMIDLK